RTAILRRPDRRGDRRGFAHLASNRDARLEDGEDLAAARAAAGRSHMTPDRWQTIERVYHAALETRDAAARNALLDRACAGDADLREEVESLLAQQSRASAFMAAPALVVAA